MVDMILAGVMLIVGVPMAGLTGFMALICIIGAYVEIKGWIWRKVTYRVHEETAKSQKIIDSIMKASKKAPLRMPQMRYAGGKEE